MTDARPYTGITPYIYVNGGRQAIEFYKQAFGAIEHSVMPAEGSERLMHADIEINGAHIFLSDFFPDYGFPPVAPQGFNLHIHADDANKWWDRAVAAGCMVTSELKEEFWGDLYGQLKDPFGITWAIGQPVQMNAQD